MKVKGNGGISAEVIAKSASSVNGGTVTTFSLEYPRFIHSEFMTHRLFSRNAASSRAIPVEKVIEQVEDNPAIPIHWGKNQKGMQAKEECTELVYQKYYSELDGYDGYWTPREWAWRFCAKESCKRAKEFSESGYHKQVVNRILEPYQFIKVVVTATSFDNFFWLRCHSDAQPEIRELADCMYKAYQQTEAAVLSPGVWHVPYVDYTSVLGYTIPINGDYENGRIDLTLAEALKVSASCCAQVSFRSLDTSLEKALRIYDRLVESKPVHSSPLEHQCTPIVNPEFKSTEDIWEDGVTHMDVDYNFWSGNFKGWIQHRQLLKDHTCWKFEKPVD